MFSFFVSYLDRKQEEKKSIAKSKKPKKFFSTKTENYEWNEIKLINSSDCVFWNEFTDGKFKKGKKGMKK